MMAENVTGLRNLFKLSSLASFEGQLSKWSRMDGELIAEHAERHHHHHRLPVRRGADPASARPAPRGVEAVCEVAGDRRSRQLLPGVDGPRPVHRAAGPGRVALIWGRTLNIPPLATNDCHYVTRDAAHNHEALLGADKQDIVGPNRFKFDGDGYYLKSAAEMRQLWDGEAPGACDSAMLLIAERVQSYADVWQPRDRMPIFPVPEGHYQASWLHHEVMAGLQRRFPSGVGQDC